MTALEKYTNHLLKVYKRDKLEDIIEYTDYANPWDIWGYVIDGVKNLNLPFETKKQLFFELIEYYMQKGFLRFKGEAIIKRREYKDENGKPKAENLEVLKCNKDTPINEIIDWFKKYFPTEKTAKEKGFESLEDEIDIWMYIYPPEAFWFWKDPQDPNDEGKWYSCDWPSHSLDD